MQDPVFGASLDKARKRGPFVYFAMIALGLWLYPAGGFQVPAWGAGQQCAGTTAHGPAALVLRSPSVTIHHFVLVALIFCFANSETERAQIKLLLVGHELQNRDEILISPILLGRLILPGAILPQLSSAHPDQVASPMASFLA